jgi:Transglycosylase SLT domain
VTALADYQSQARRFARRYGLDPNIFVRQINQESGFRPHAVSPAGARGIAQFMPGTAAGLGVNPDHPTQALKAAAKLMADYVHKYGSYKNALVAYNAGPGRVGHSLPSETQHYIANILGGSNPSAGKTGGAGNVPQTRTTTSSTSVTPDAQQAQRAALAQFVLSNRPDPLALAENYAALGQQTQTTTKVRTSRGGSSSSSAPSSGGNFAKGHSPLKELFWQGAGGIDAKNGVKEAQGFVSGHTDHVHVAAGPKTVVELGHLAQQKFGLHVGENPHFGGVHPVHVTNSFHYKGEAIDVSGPPDRMRAFAHYVASLYGIK